MAINLTKGQRIEIRLPLLRYVNLQGFKLKFYVS